MLNDTQNLSQLVPGTFTSCYGIIIDFTYPKSTKKKGILCNILRKKIYLIIF